MMPGAHHGNSDQSELFNSLKAYLKNRNRLQPFIGLSSIIECVNGGAFQRDAFYICEVCVCRLDMADMRNHIMGSLHRYNYIKTKHPELLSDFEEGSCLSKLAWPLMDIAKKIEEKEGPGNVQVVEFDKTSYQHMENQSDDAAKNVMDFLKGILKQSEPEISQLMTSERWQQPPHKRIVLFSPKVSDSSSGSFVDSSSFLSNYAGQAPLIGLARVIECQSEGGQTYCFLCHCCRVRSLKNDIVDHLTHASHISNYLMETHPEQLERVDLNDIYQVELLAEWLIKKDEGMHTNKLKVVQVPEFLCYQMTGKSYNWCVKKLGWSNSDFPEKCINVKRQRNSWFPHQKGHSREAADVQVPKGKKTIQKSKKKRNNPVFKVTLPVTQGSLLVERTSFSKDLLPTFHYSPSENASKFSPDPQTATCDFPSGSFDISADDTTLSSQYYLDSSTDIPEHEYEHIQEEMDEHWINSYQDQNLDSKTNIASKDGLSIGNVDGQNAYNAETPPLFHGEYVPHHDILWPVETKENERSAANPYYLQQPQYMAPNYFPQQHMFSSGYVPDGGGGGGGGMIPQVPQSGNYLSHNNFTLPDCSPSFTGFYAEQRENTQPYASYPVSDSGWGTHQPLPASGQPPWIGPCCVPPNPRAAFPNVDEPGSSNAIYYPMSNIFPVHKNSC